MIVIAIRQDAAGCIKPSKKASMDRIDGIVAVIMAVGPAALEEEQFGPVIFWI